MIVPTGNLLNMALSVIASQPFDYYAYASRTNNERGLYVTAYADPVVLYGSIQAVPRKAYQQQGLDYAKNYISIHVSADVIDVTRDRTSDQIGWNNRRFQVIGEDAWFNIDGWVALIAVQVEMPVAPV
jgi:hypothetical protein